MCGSGYLTYPKFLPPTLYFFSPNSEVGREQQNKIILFCHSIPTSEFEGKKNTYQNDNLKWKFLRIQSLVLEVKGLNKVISSNIDHFISVLSYFISSRSEYSTKNSFQKIKISILPSYPNFLHPEPHIFFIWPKIKRVKSRGKYHN